MFFNEVREGCLDARCHSGCLFCWCPNIGVEVPVTSAGIGSTLVCRKPTEECDRWIDRTGWRNASRKRRAHLRAVAYRLLGSMTEADDAVQEAWLRLSGSDADGINNLGGWLTTAVARACLDMLRSRRSRREELLGEVARKMTERDDAGNPENQALLTDSVGVALLVVLDTLPPAERLAFVLHDMFALSFDEIAPIVGRSTTAARQLASRGRRRVRGGANVPEAQPRPPERGGPGLPGGFTRRQVRRAPGFVGPGRPTARRHRGRTVRRGAGGPRGGGCSENLLRARAGGTTCPHQRSRGRGLGSWRGAARRIQLHDHAREDRQESTCSPTPRALVSSS